MITELTPDLGELIWIFIGDGFANRYGNSYVIEFTGNTSETKYFENIIIPLLAELSAGNLM